MSATTNPTDDRQQNFDWTDTKPNPDNADLGYPEVGNTDGIDFVRTLDDAGTFLLIPKDPKHGDGDKFIRAEPGLVVDVADHA